MLEREPSQTAFAAATHQAAHQVLEQGRIRWPEVVYEACRHSWVVLSDSYTLD
jgi:hypothetical protein